MKTLRKRWRSTISSVQKNRLQVRGIAQEKIIESYSYEQMVLLLILGKKQKPIAAKMFRHVLISHCSHGITGQSTLAVRMGADTQANFLNSIIAGVSVGSGPYHQGGLELAMIELRSASASGNAQMYVRTQLANKKVIYGFGHRFHSRDPRAKKLLNICKNENFLGDHVKCVLLMESELYKKKRIRMNIEAACAAILLDLRFPPELASLIILLGRGPMLAAVYMERLVELRKRNKFFPKLTVEESYRG